MVRIYTGMIVNCKQLVCMVIAEGDYNFFGMIIRGTVSSELKRILQNGSVFSPNLLKMGPS